VALAAGQTVAAQGAPVQLGDKPVAGHPPPLPLAIGGGTRVGQRHKPRLLQQPIWPLGAGKQMLIDQLICIPTHDQGHGLSGELAAFQRPHCHHTHHSVELVVVDQAAIAARDPCPGSSADVVSGTGSYVGSRASKITPGHHLHPRA
jgi:hypothetical protein